MDYSIKTPQQLGQVLKGFRRDRKLTQGVLSARVGLAQNTISKIETNPTRSNVEGVFKLLAALDLDLVLRSRQSDGKKSAW
jgi:HTH-type transcriptional regulator / antitoxin HipB